MSFAMNNITKAIGSITSEHECIWKRKEDDFSDTFFNSYHNKTKHDISLPHLNLKAG